MPVGGAPKLSQQEIETLQRMRAEALSAPPIQRAPPQYVVIHREPSDDSGYEEYQESPVHLEPQVPTEEQEVHIEKLMNILDVSTGCMDTSETGTGKTLIAITVAARRGLKPMIVCTADMTKKWDMYVRTQGLIPLEVISYESLRNGNSRFLFKDSDGNHQVDQNFVNALENGVYLIFDEIIKVKNPKSGNAIAAGVLGQFLAETVYNSGYTNPSRVHLASALPSDIEASSESFSKILGIIRYPNQELAIYDRSSGIFDMTGLIDMYDWCMERNPELTNQIWNTVYNGKGMKKIYRQAYDFFTKIVVPNIASSMAPLSAEVIRYASNGFFQVGPEIEKELSSAISSLNAIMSVDPITGMVKVESMGEFTKGLVRIENLKKDLFIRLATDYIQKNPTGKVIIALNYPNKPDESYWHGAIPTTDYIYNVLSDMGYRVGMLVGSMSKNQREEVKQMFQEDSDNIQILITSRSSSMGIDLDDQYGNRPRLILINPSYHFSDMVQFMGRVYRRMTKSDPTIWIVYGPTNGSAEVGILNRMADKTDTAKGYIVTVDALPLPGELPSTVEYRDGRITSGASWSENNSIPGQAPTEESTPVRKGRGRPPKAAVYPSRIPAQIPPSGLPPRPFPGMVTPPPSGPARGMISPPPSHVPGMMTPPGPVPGMMTPPGPVPGMMTPPSHVPGMAAHSSARYIPGMVAPPSGPVPGMMTPSQSGPAPGMNSPFRPAPGMVTPPSSTRPIPPPKSIPGMGAPPSGLPPRPAPSSARPVPPPKPAPISGRPPMFVTNQIPYSGLYN